MITRNQKYGFATPPFDTTQLDSEPSVALRRPALPDNRAGSSAPLMVPATVSGPPSPDAPRVAGGGAGEIERALRFPVIDAPAQSPGNATTPDYCSTPVSQAARSAWPHRDDASPF